MRSEAAEHRLLWMGNFIRWENLPKENLVSLSLWERKWKAGRWRELESEQKNEEKDTEKAPFWTSDCRMRAFISSRPRTGSWILLQHKTPLQIHSQGIFFFVRSGRISKSAHTQPYLKCERATVSLYWQALAKKFQMCTGRITHQLCYK